MKNGDSAVATHLLWEQKEADVTAPGLSTETKNHNRFYSVFNTSITILTHIFPEFPHFSILKVYVLTETLELPGVVP